MRTGKTSPDKGRAEKKHLLLCDPAGVIGERLSCSEAYVSNSLQCLNQAVINPPDIIAVCFDALSLTYRDVLLELCTVLKQNPHTRDCLILALLNAKHRMVVEALHDAGVDFVKILHPETALPDSLPSIAEILEERDSPQYQLESLCPFLHYSEVDSRHEITVCGAYLDRLVLGGRRLHDICETGEHLQCEYFVNPRLGS